MTFQISWVARPAVDQMFTTLDHLALRGAGLAVTKDVEESVVLGWRLATDMFPLVAQFQLATEIPARGLSRLAGTEIPDLPNVETSFAELRERIVAAREIIDALPDDALDAEPDAEIKVPMGPTEMTFPRHAYLQGFILPNLYFHTTAAYLILRHLGVDLGKRDFLAAT